MFDLPLLACVRHTRRTPGRLGPAHTESLKRFEGRIDSDPKNFGSFYNHNSRWSSLESQLSYRGEVGRGVGDVIALFAKAFGSSYLYNNALHSTSSVSAVLGLYKIKYVDDSCVLKCFKK